MWVCDECGAKYRTLRAAEKAQRDGCRAGCSGIDIHEADEGEGERISPLTYTEKLQAAADAGMDTWADYRGER